MHLQQRLASQIQQMLFQVSFAVICNRYALYMSHLDITLIPLTVRIGIVMFDDVGHGPNYGCLQLGRSCRDCIEIKLLEIFHG